MEHHLDPDVLERADLTRVDTKALDPLTMRGWGTETEEGREVIPCPQLGDMELAACRQRVCVGSVCLGCECVWEVEHAEGSCNK